MVTAEFLRGEIAKQRYPMYRLAAALPLHPSRLSQYLNGKIPMRPKLAERILEVLKRESVK